MYIELYVWLKFDIFALTKRLWKLHLIGSVPIKHSLYFPYNYHQFTKVLSMKPRGNLEEIMGTNVQT